MAHPLLVFLHVAKTGGRSIETMLRSSYGLNYCRAVPWRPPLAPGATGRSRSVATYDHDEFRRLTRLAPGLRAVGGHALTVWSSLHELRPVRYFAFLRDPVRRMASHYQFHRATTPNPLDLDAWCAWHEPQEHQLKFFSRDADPQEAMNVVERHGIFIGLVESFDESVIMLRQAVAPDLNPAYRRANVARDNTVARAVLDDPAQRERIAAMVRGEQILYEWVRETWYPRQVAAHGEGLAAEAEHFAADTGRGFNAWNDRLYRARYRFWLDPWQKWFMSRS
ncbi:MAG: sulfotransferase family 2 domain-containing protein [bacterium]|nr:sulfotransferase family 2 domain-containing protein [bacterium]